MAEAQSPRLDRFFTALSRGQRERPWLFLLVGLALALGSAPLILKLKLDTSFVALLPDDKPSVRDMNAASARVGGLTTLTLVLESSETDALTRFARDLVPRLSRMEAERVYSVEWNVGEYEDFVIAHKHLYAGLDDLREIHDALTARLEYERARANPFYIPLDDPPEAPEAVIARMQKRADEARAKQARFPGGFYLHPDGDFLVIFVRTDLSGGDFAGTNRLLDAIRHEVRALGPEHYAPDLQLEFAGDVMHAREEHQAIKSELVLATALTFALTLLVIYLFFRNLRAIPMLGLSVAIPAAIAFGAAYLTVGALNTSTAFLGSIVVGNGINPNIIWLARYFEERRKGLSMADALYTTHRTTFEATISVAVASSISYGSLVVTDFRGFRDFGVIAGTGMLICWLGSILVLPPLVVLAEKLRPLVRDGEKERKAVFGTLVFKAMSFSPKTTLVLVTVFTVVCGVFIARAVANDPMEYDFRKLKSADRGSTRVTQLHTRMHEFIPRSGTGNGIALVVDRREDAAPLVEDLERRRASGAPFGRVRSIDDLLPHDQEAKIEVLGQIRAQLEEAKQFASDEQRRRIEEMEPPVDLRPIAAEDLPESVARLYTERDGTRGRIVMVEGAEGRSIWDGKYLVEWAHALREARLPDGRRPYVVGRAPVFADMLESMLADGPKAIAVSMVLTAAIVFMTFRRKKHGALALSSLTLGLTWMLGVMAMLGMKLNFLNFVSIPISCGNGADYSLNVMKRYVQEPEGEAGVRAAVEDSGGAVVLCSMTTIIGYMSLHVSANQALRSFGAAMTISELCCLLAAVITLPAYLLVRTRARPGGEPQPN